MKLAKYTLFSLIGLLLAFQSYAQPDTRRMNISIGIFTPSATSYDYEGAIGVVGSTGYTVDDIEPGDMFWDDASRYRVDSIEIIVAGTSATVWVTDLYGAGAPQSGKGTLGKPSDNLGLQPLTENGSNFITEAQEAKIMTDNLQRIDSLAGDGNGIPGALPDGPVIVDANNNSLIIDSTSVTRISAVGTAQGDLVVSGASSLASSLSHIVGGDTSQINVRAPAGISLNTDQNITFNISGVPVTWPTTAPSANQVLGEGATDDNVLEWVDITGDGNLGTTNVTIPASTQRQINFTDYSSTLAIRDVDAGRNAFEFESDINSNDSENTTIKIYTSGATDYLRLGHRGGAAMTYAKGVNYYQAATGLISIISGITDEGYDIYNPGDGLYGMIFSNTDGGGIKIYNSSTTKTGIEYAADYSSGYVDRSLIDKGYITPTTGADSLDRVMTWRRTGASQIKSYKITNDGDFRTASASGNILPYDDIIECVPDVTVHLPAPAVQYQGKIYHIYVGGAGAGGGVTIDVVDGSSTIQTNPSLSMTSAWETCTLTCNGSQWVILNHKP